MFKRIFFLIAIFLLVTNIAFADNEGGVTTTKTQELGIQTKTAEFFTSYALTSTSFVYNNAGGTSSTDGWVDVSAYRRNAITFSVTTWNSGTLTARIESQGGTTTTFGNVVTIDYGTTTAGPVTLHDVGQIIPIQEGMKKVRVGWKVSSATGSGTVNTDGFFQQ